MTDFKVYIIVENDRKYFKKIEHRVCSIAHLPLYSTNVIELELNYPNYRSASAACRNFRKNPRIFEVSLKAQKDYK